VYVYVTQTNLKVTGTAAVRGSIFANFGLWHVMCLIMPCNITFEDYVG
jgi:hypothetical protein